jgi:chromate transporter
MRNSRTLKRASEAFTASLRLGLTSFGGPIAHLGYFEHFYVRKKHWLTAEEFSQTVALCQLLPGPTSSQVNFLIGLRHAGWRGALASWAGFTLPSALVMFAVALFLPDTQNPVTQVILHGLKLVAVAVVAQAVYGMARRLCPDRLRAGLALAGMAVLLLTGGAYAQAAVITLGAGAGWLWSRDAKMERGNRSSFTAKKTALVALALFLALLAGLPLLALVVPNAGIQLAQIFYHAGALVFGGGHVVLPLLRDALVPAFMTDDTFLAGYGAAQALPGPLFTLSAYLGAMAAPAGSAAPYAFAALVFMFLPGMLVAIAGSYCWQWLTRHPAAQGALAGVNAAVVGILAAALYDPVWKTAILGKADVAVAAAGLLLLERWKIAPVFIVILCVSAALILHFAGFA